MMIKKVYLNTIYICLFLILLAGCKDQSATLNQTTQIVEPTQTVEETIDNEEAEYEEEAIQETYTEPTLESESDVDDESTADEYSQQNGAIEEDQQENSSDNTTVEEKIAKVTVSVTGPDDIGIMFNEEVPFIEGETAFECLLRCEINYALLLETSGKGMTAYIQGINDVYELDYGALSGWMYAVNGEYPLKGVGQFVLSEGDVISFRYTVDGGKDIGARE